MRLAKELTPSSPILRNKTFSPNCAIGFLHLRPVLLISLVFPSLPILILFMTCAAKRGSQLSNGLSSAIRTLVFVQRKFEEFYTVVSLLSQPFPHDRWPCDHPQVVLAESLPLLHMRESQHLGVLFVFGSLSHFKMILRKPRSLMKPTRNEMEYAVGPFRSQHVAPV